MDRTQLWGRRLLSGGFVALAVLGVRSASTGSVGDLLAGDPGTPDAEHCLVRDLAVTYDVRRGDVPGGYGVAGARVDGPGRCAGSTMSITFAGRDGNPLARATGTYDPAAPTLSLDAGGTIAIDDVATIAVVLFD